jgi:hypothetical protein
MRLAAATAGVDHVFECIQSEAAARKERKQGSILSWLQGYYAAPTNRENFSPYTPSLPTLNETARGMGRIPLHYMSEEIRRDLQYMAVKVVGPRNNTTTNYTEYLYPHVDIDDVAIHFRCGDIMKGFNSDAYGIVQYDSYRQYISPFTRTIGIVTASFNETLLRHRDQGTAKVCRLLIHGLVEYLQYFFPRAVISIRNGPEETLALAYARLVMANQTFCSPSTFSVFPAIASFGTSYIQRANLTYFVAPMVEKYNDVKFMDGPLMSAIDVFYYNYHEKNERKRITLMLNWLMRPCCTVQHLNATTGNTLVTCGTNEKINGNKETTSRGVQ